MNFRANPTPRKTTDQCNNTPHPNRFLFPFGGWWVTLSNNTHRAAKLESCRNRIGIHGRRTWEKTPSGKDWDVGWNRLVGSNQRKGGCDLVGGNAMQKSIRITPQNRKRENWGRWRKQSPVFLALREISVPLGSGKQYPLSLSLLGWVGVSWTHSCGFLSY